MTLNLISLRTLLLSSLNMLSSTFELLSEVKKVIELCKTIYKVREHIGTCLSSVGVWLNDQMSSLIGPTIFRCGLRDFG